MTQVESAAQSPLTPGPAPELVPQPDRFSQWVVRMSARAPKWTAPAAVLLCVGGALGYTLVADPTNSSAGDPPSCIIKLTTGFDCPGCGGTRAAWYLLHGDLGAASRHHMFFVFAVPFLVYAYVAWAGEKVFGRKLPQLRVGSKAIAWFLAAWGVFTILRNLPWAPFTFFYV